ncbi:VanZ family protein [Aspergillus ruber CBS 135680]|uniref:Putative VanZ domain protein n=1 Tax=Aspergillus ruber (strain CBS 135680) TaxID=1388766 RepID=A0A017SCW4_ASPRC|nr:putative VanZ domain protein [Aspergillus ruber CBS 135680]EYE94616.1 putative VanZ domain protein [Aspergillus ruber CBS 135680]
MRIRYPFAGAFILLILVAAYAGLLPHNTSPSIPSNLQPNDKFLHLITFFLLSLIFYWIFDTSRRRALHLTLLICTLGFGVGSEILQGLLPNDRPFDPLDLLANLVGSLGAVGLCGWYHRRMLERRRKARYGALADEEGDGEDVELGVTGHGRDEESGLGPQENGVMSLEQEVDNWDENAVDNWDEEDRLDENGNDAHGQKTDGAGATAGNNEGKKRSD